MSSKQITIIALAIAGGCAAAYRVYNVWQFNHWKGKKQVTNKQSIEEAQYQLFLKERREKRIRYLKIGFGYILVYGFGYLMGYVDSEYEKERPEIADRNSVETQSI
ncbi:hypothetical protein WA158_003835 [Blastocystis sp. Blastoise]